MTRLRSNVAALHVFTSTILVAATAIGGGCTNDTAMGSGEGTNASTGMDDSTGGVSTSSTGTSATTDQPSTSMDPTTTTATTSTTTTTTTTTDAETSTGPMDTGTTDPGDTESTDTSSETDPDACVAECVADAPEGWEGPVVRIPSEGLGEDSACGGNFPNSVAVGFETLTAPGPSCSCSCAAPAGGACDPEINVELYDSNCVLNQQGICTANANLNACASVDEVLSVGPDTFVDDNRWGIRLIADEPAVAQAPTCAPLDASVVGPAQTSDAFELCGPAGVEAGPCGDAEVCLPQVTNPFVGGFCIWTDGDTECPDGPFSEKEVLFAHVDDTRGCSACGCGSAQGVGCEGEITVVASYTAGLIMFNDPAETFAADNTCTVRITPNYVPNAGVTYVVDYTAESPTASACTSFGGSASGAATPEQPTTVCCTP